MEENYTILIKNNISLKTYERDYVTLTAIFMITFRGIVDITTFIQQKLAFNFILTVDKKNYLIAL